MDRLQSKKIGQQYDRIAGMYNLIDWVIPSRWRRKVTEQAYGRVLEVGVGTGLNVPFYPPGCEEVFGIDVSGQMLALAQNEVPRCRAKVTFAVMDVQDLALASDSFDCVVAALVFCTVPDPRQGLQECYRVLKPGGKLILLEHVGSATQPLRKIMDAVNPLTIRLLDDHINRDTTQTVTSVGFKLETEENLLLDIVRIMVANK